VEGRHCGWRRRGREGHRGWGWVAAWEGERGAKGGEAIYIGRVRWGCGVVGRGRWAGWSGCGVEMVDWGEGVGEVGRRASGTGGLRREPTSWLSAKGTLC
jgi:hypothetical protein